MSTFVGIDLGTTNSVLATFDGEQVSVVPNGLGENLTPSVVRLDATGTPIVGRKARRFLETDPANTRAEFKRLMGTAEGLAFDAAGKSLLPEELSAAVLASLLADARDALGFPPRAAVISTPALFELPQCHATSRAGTRAGLEEVILIQEPIASAIAAGWRAGAVGGRGDDTWLVFDLGGGTLDISLLETREGRLRVVDHAGDNFLGGRDIDDAIVAWAVRELGQGLDVSISSPAQRRAMAKLRAACEQAKIELSRVERATIAVSELALPGSAAPIDVELPLARAQLESLTAPFVERSLALVRRLLASNRRSAAEIARVVLVGGPTLMPSVRAAVGDLVGGRIAEGVDPMTVVARGAALYAATAGLEARPVRPRVAGAGLAVRIEHPPVTADLAPFVVGRFMPGPGESLPARVRIEREDGGFQTPDAALSAEGSFVLQVGLAPNQRTRFRLAAFDGAGAPLRLATEGFAIVHGLSIADPPLARSIGVACADDLVQVYFQKGTPLPARRTFVHHTVKPIAAGSTEDLLSIPVVQGESARAHRTRLVGMLAIAGGAVRRDVAAGTRVEVTLELDRSGQLRTRADVPAIGQTFEDVAAVLVPSASLQTVGRELEATARRADEIQRRAFQAGASAAAQAMGEVAALLAEAEASLPLALAGDPDAGLKIHRLLLDAGNALDEGEAALEWPDLERETRSCMMFFTPLVSEWGTAAEQQLYEQALQGATDAQRRRDGLELERQLSAMRSIGKASYFRNPETLEGELEWAAAHVTQSLDVARTQSLLERARAAEKAGNPGAARALLSQVWDLFPGSPELQRKSFGSGVR